MNNLKNKCKYLEKKLPTPHVGCQKCKETLSILTYAKSTITYNLKRVPLVLFITSKKLEKTNTLLNNTNRVLFGCYH